MGDHEIYRIRDRKAAGRKGDADGGKICVESERCCDKAASPLRVETGDIALAALC